MPATLTDLQREELQTLLLARRDELHAQMRQNEQNLAPPTADEGAVLQRNVAREVDQALAYIDAPGLGRIVPAPKALDAGSYGLCDACGCPTAFERSSV